MGLKQDVVIKNQFTVNRNGVATKGATPGFYVLQYMARNNATEVLSPVQYRDIENFQLRYMARKSATDKAITRDGLKYRMKREEGKSGVAFSEDNISLSDSELKEKAELIQKAFDEGHTVQEIVLSFDEDFLKNTGIVAEEFKAAGAGSYRGQIDQLKLRRAVTDGLLYMASGIGYKKPVFTGVIQVDTKHVHAHIAMCDLEFSEHRLLNEEEKGKLSEKAKRLIRRGMNNSLREMSQQHSFRNQIDVERQNVISFVKRFAFNKIKNGARLQLIISALPPNKSLWRAASNAKVMRRPNELVREFLNDIFENRPEESGYVAFEHALNSYIEEKAKNDNLTRNEVIELRERIMNQFYERCMNGLYNIIKEYDNPQDIMTSMINLSIRDMDELLPKAKKNDDSVSFEVRLRGYKDRLQYYQNKADLFSRYLENYYRQPVTEESRVMSDFFEEEVSYHRALVKKYSHFLNYRKNVSETQLNEANKLYETYNKLAKQKNDYEMLLNNPPKVLTSLTPEEQDDYVKEFYNIEKGSWFLDEALKDSMREELSVITTRYMLAKEEYEKFLLDNNLVANEITIDDNVKELSEPKPIDSSNDGFEESKALDIHALTFDFPEGADVSDTNARIFYDAMVHRREVYDAAMRYLIGTGQNVHVFDDIKDDIEDMENFYQNVLSKTHRIEPLEVTPEPGMERSLAPRIEEIENETDIVKNVVNKIDVESLDQEQAENQAESESEPDEEQTLPELTPRVDLDEPETLPSRASEPMEM